MKQGSGNSRSGSQKTEPVSKAVNVAGVSQIGNAVGPARAVEPLYAGRGYKAPTASSSTHKAGSQGKH